MLKKWGEILRLGDNIRLLGNLEGEFSMPRKVNKVGMEVGRLSPAEWFECCCFWLNDRDPSKNQ